MRPIHLITALLLLVFGGLYMYSGELEERHAEPAARYLATALQDISGWQASDLIGHLSPEARQSVSNEQVQTLLNNYSELGAFRSMGELRFSRLVAALSAFGSDQRLSYSTVAQYQHREAIVTATLLLRDGRYSLYNFNIAFSETNQPDTTDSKQD